MHTNDTNDGRTVAEPTPRDDDRTCDACSLSRGVGPATLVDDRCISPIHICRTCAELMDAQTRFGDTSQCSLCQTRDRAHPRLTVHIAEVRVGWLCDDCHRCVTTDPPGDRYADRDRYGEDAIIPDGVDAASEAGR